MYLDELLKIDNLNNYKVHLAVKPSDWIDPFDVYNETPEDLADWNSGYCNNRCGNRPYVFMFVRLTPKSRDHWLFVGLFHVNLVKQKDADEPYYEVTFLNDYKDLIGRLICKYESKGQNMYRNAESVFPKLELDSILDKPYKLPKQFKEDLQTILKKHYNNLQIIKYGAPGTGKTYTAKDEANNYISCWQGQFGLLFNDCYKDIEHNVKTMQFHPSYGYEDFIEGLRPTDKGLSLVNGMFKNLCITAGKWELDVYNISKALDAVHDWERMTIKDVKDLFVEYFNRFFGESRKWEELTDNDIKTLFDRCQDKIKLNYDCWKDLLNYNVIQDDKGNFIKDNALLKDIIPPYFLIIDEINRAELSRVFGELMYCLEYRGPWEGSIETQYSYLNDDTTGMLKVGDNDYRFFIPHNVHIIGTMNNIDRSVESFDFALRRRFCWERVDPSEDVLNNYLSNLYDGQWKQLVDRWKKLNDVIKENKDFLGEDYCIGHAYLMKLKYDKSLSLQAVSEELWKDCSEPLLDEYLRGTGERGNTIKDKCINAWKG